MGFLQELLNTEDNMRQMVERARDQIPFQGSIQAFCLQKLFILFSSSDLFPLAIQLLSLAMRVTCINLPNFPMQVAELDDTAPPN